jgi:phenylacetic acid degradation operon negative regulatory protein
MGNEGLTVRRPVCPSSDSTQDLVLTVLGLHMSDSKSRAWSGALVDLFGGLGFSAAAIRAALARLVASEMLMRHRRGKLIDYSLTRNARVRLAEDQRRMANFGRRPESAEVWTVLHHTIPMDRRADFRRLSSSLSYRGFGLLQRGVWVAAGDHESAIRSLVDELDVDIHVAYFLARLSAGSQGAFPSCVWDPGDLAHRYDVFLAEFTGLGSAAISSALADREAFTSRVRLIWAFRSLSVADPELPDSPLALRRRRSRAVALFDLACGGLGAAADRYFKRLTCPTPTDPDGRYEIFENSAHAAHHDEADRFAAVVGAFAEEDAA